MRAYVQRAERLGLEAAFVKLGRRVLVRPATFFRLVTDPTRIEQTENQQEPSWRPSQKRGSVR
jgi:hypothetical protein